MNSDLLILGFAWYLVFIVSTVLHEAAHAFVALKLGDSTAYRAGQVTLDPRPHIRREPIGTVVIPILSFALTRGAWMMGWASAPYNAAWSYRFPKRSALMALAGPLANLSLVVLAGILIRVGVLAEIFVAPRPGEFRFVFQLLTETTVAPDGGFARGLAMMLSILFSLNLILFAFNLLPVPPLDGSGVLPLFLPERVARKYLDFMSQPMFSLLGIIVAWKLFPEVLVPVYFIAFRLLYFGYDGP